VPAAPSSAEEVIAQSLESFRGYPAFRGTLVLHSVEGDFTCRMWFASHDSESTSTSTGSHKDGVRVWALDIDELLEIARENVTRPFTDEECLQYLHEDPCPPSRSHQTGH
jgi:hypothetical protein